MSLRGCAFVFEGNFHLLDHIAPLASLLNIPLIANDRDTANLAKTYYPEVETRFWPDIEFRLKELSEEFDVLFNCQYWEPSFKECLRTLFHKDMQLVFCPHGQSDKGYKTPLLEYYRLQDKVLIYGNLLQKMLEELNIWDSIKSHTRVGNYRLLYHRLYQARGNGWSEDAIFSKLITSNQTLLYAPTWNDADGATSFFRESQKLIEELPSHWNLIIKLHPLLIERDPVLFYRLTKLEEKKANFFVVHQFPLIYPILEKIDAYLGDYSSVGYDVLAFQKPMFFWPQDSVPPARLHSCGQILSLNKNTFDQIDEGIETSQCFSATQLKLYNQCFDGHIDKESVFTF